MSSILVGTDDGGRVFLRFSATIVNVGHGPLIVDGHRQVDVVEQGPAA